MQSIVINHTLGRSGKTNDVPGDDDKHGKEIATEPHCSLEALTDGLNSSIGKGSELDNFELVRRRRRQTE
ncbi:hypothetical protein SAY86_027312 [Trapa natans]|uniref:Uncharacterized protein n=1 Tax=Trapa natans TaxID=22666 RepID=A0AAN7KU68_TRANT|nr:hypothetical protein SAY86_027312 [Trapa natans]